MESVRTAGRKLVKNSKSTPKGLAVGALDQFVMKFWGPCQSLEVKVGGILHSSSRSRPVLDISLITIQKLLALF